MTLIKSISGIRGTIGGIPGENLTALDAVQFATAYAQMLIAKHSGEIAVVIGRDARPSGPMIHQLVNNTLRMMGVHVIDLDLATTPTVEMAVAMEKAHGGIILTASHNPKQWNALKLLNEKGEFINAEDGAELLQLIEQSNAEFAPVEKLGSYVRFEDALSFHIEAILSSDRVHQEAIRKAKLKVVVDAVNSVGGIAIPQLLRNLGVEVVEMYCEPNGQFPHNPEPLAEHLTELSRRVVAENAHMGITVDPDVDRLAFVCEDGSMFGEEYTLVAVADYFLSQTPGNTVSNLSSTRALRDVTDKYINSTYSAAAVGEVNVVAEMKKVNAIIGGEGNGGIIWPELHYGRDALAGIALFLSYYVREQRTMTQLRDSYPQYAMAKKKIQLDPSMNVDEILEATVRVFENEKLDTRDGVKIDFPEEWVHLRKSNTEPIIRVYTEAKSKERANELADEMIERVKEIAE
jgi:phosphomannomutase